jgi:hypothetical protein
VQLWFGGYTFRHDCIPLGMRSNFAIFRRPEPSSRSPY